MWGKKKKPKLDENGKPIPPKLADKDKIFNNTYGDSIDPDDKMHYELLISKIDKIIKGSEYEHLNEATPEGVIKKLNKVQINRVYSHIIEKIGDGYTRVDIFSVISDYFDVFPNKFYNSLSNKFKDELIRELDDKYNILEKRKIRKLF